MDISKIIEIFKNFSNISNNDINKFIYLIENSVNSISSKLSYKISDLSEQDLNMFNFACAAHAFYSFALIISSNSASSLKLSELSISLDQDKLVDSAYKLKKHFIESISHILIDTNFYFRKVN